MPDSPAASHFLWTRPETVWRQLLRPWFAACARSGWEGGKGGASFADSFAGGPAKGGSEPSLASSVASKSPSAWDGFRHMSAAPMLLVPDAGMIAWIKGRLVAERIGCLGVHFHTVGTLRGLLAQAYGITGRLALREDLHLLMGQAARSLPDNPVAQAAVLDPAALSRLCDRIDRAGWRAEGFSTAAGRQLATRYFELLAAQGLRTVADVERELLECAERSSVPACGYLLAAGFGCEHSDALLLLRAASLSTRQAPIFCLDTGGSADAIATTPAALSWQAACEEYFGVGQPLDSEADSDSEEAPAATGHDAAALAAAGDDTDGLAAVDRDTDGPALADRGATNRDVAERDAITDSSAVADLPLWAAAAERATEPETGFTPLADSAPSAPIAPSASSQKTDDGSQATDAQPLSFAMKAWAQALAAHSAVEPQWRATLQQGLRLLVFRTLEEEARHAVSLVRHWLSALGTQATPMNAADKADWNAAEGHFPPRIGIILPGGGSVLGREIAAGLSALGIAHYDSLGHPPARSDAQRLLEGWCSWQNSNQIDDFNAFLAELCRQDKLPATDLRYWERAADKALAQTLCAELGVIAAYLGRPAASAAQPAGERIELGAEGADSGSEFVPEGGRTVRKGSGGSAQQTAEAGSEEEAVAEVISVSESQAAVNKVLEDWIQLPAEAAFADFWALAQPVLRFCNWPQRQEPLEERARAFGETLTGRLPRNAFINWLRSVTQVPGRTRDALGHEPFATVHLVTLSEASRQEWSHLCVVGMVHGEWPPLEADSALLDPERCAELNRRAERPSRFGEGQSSIGGGHTFLASIRQHRESFDAAFLRLLGQTGAQQVVLSRYRFSPTADQTEAFASEYFMRAVYGATAALEVGESLPPSPLTGGQEVALLAPSTVGALSTPALPPAAGQEASYPQVALAYARRRDPHSGFDAYSYALATPPAEPLRLSCSHWAEALNRPAHAWYRYVLRLRKRRRASESDFRHQSQGTWVHDWLNPSADRRFGQPPAFGMRPGSGQWRQQVAERADSLRRSIAGAYFRAGRQLPQWWQSDWSAALAVADAFAETLGLKNVADNEMAGNPRSDAAPAPQVVADWTAAAGEWPLPPLRLDLPGHPLDGLVLEGIVDLVLTSDSAAARALSASGQGGTHTVSGEAPPLWVIDYKTGSDGSLNLKAWESRGAGLQLVLYGFALRACGAGSVQLSLLRKNSSLEPQLDLDDLSLEAPIWQKLALPMRAGVFGMRGALRDPHGFTGDYPIATLGVDPVVLERKARLSGLL